ncbi:cyanidin 3-O-galactoside 2''-O-xylosyltransferase FGGT1-like [Malus sylvestris]|uniref:cyanidin 3-O-galactoside 2''-O-xylosyltransferase FGGT1-like n=1 Tax=Malus sylvestris TaxID=3752 RepID=UPI0021ACDB41|nr:cyanidin 3-O-galactoside 2''-O-xylosyltransferase FGGT1-like [Malus sylvestris]XP_050106317.1 cyanidin 3-O-galactoside 2''-O-xylosyltransferase FGGT1-like [Malus sylvestris]XP_050106318.1 cyanidin 3-O-galactoside 2''-O-xylosyltransferase FGGT1-like [Malus sylvestris]
MSNYQPLPSLHIAMYPWFAMGHLTPYLHLSNKLAERGHRISFFVPTKTQQKLQALNLHPHLISFIPITVPHVDGLPPGAETTNDVPFPSYSLLMTAMDLTQPAILQAICELNPDFVFFDFTPWLPKLLRELGTGIKSINYIIITPALVGYVRSPERKVLMEKSVLPEDDLINDLINPPPSFPPSSIKLPAHEARMLAPFLLKEFGSGTKLIERLIISLNDCDAVAFRTCREMEGKYCDYLETQLRKPVLLAGPVVPETPTTELDEKWAKWLESFEAKSVIYCAFGTECVLKIDQLQELLLGFELTGLPFFAALKPPMGVEAVESALPEGFEGRVKGRGVVSWGWVQQPLILKHPSVGCFVTHCGPSSLMEGLVSDCQLVLLPNVADQLAIARVMGRDLRVGVEVEKGEEDGVFTKEGVCKAVRDVMDEESEVGKEVRRNHTKWREFLSSKGLENSYIDSFVEKLHALLGLNK